jgi:hypothetical protein
MARLTGHLVLISGSLVAKNSVTGKSDSQKIYVRFHINETR